MSAIMANTSGLREWNEETYVVGFRKPYIQPDLRVSTEQKAGNAMKQSTTRSNTFRSASSSSSASSIFSNASTFSSPTSATSISDYPESVGQTTDLLQSFDRINLMGATRGSMEFDSVSDILPPALQQPIRRQLFDVPEIQPVEETLDALLPCTFSFCCTQTFRSENQWLQHNLGHFRGFDPAPETLCIFCDKTFHNLDARMNWNNRMRHILDNHYRTNNINGERPDFQLIKYMHRKRLISQQCFDHATAYTEVSAHIRDELVPKGTQPSSHGSSRTPPQRHNVAINQKQQDREERKRNGGKRRNHEERRRP